MQVEEDLLWTLKKIALKQLQIVYAIGSIQIVAANIAKMFK
jgi:hypothetical protein